MAAPSRVSHGSRTLHLTAAPASNLHYCEDSREPGRTTGDSEQCALRSMQLPKLD